MSAEQKVKVTKIIRKDGITFRPAGGQSQSSTSKDDDKSGAQSEASASQSKPPVTGKKKAGKVIKRADGTKIVVVDGKIVKKMDADGNEIISNPPSTVSEDPGIRDVSPDPLNFDESYKDCPFIVWSGWRHLCTLCNSPLNSDKQIMEHLTGKKHLTAAEEFDVNPVELELPDRYPRRNYHRNSYPRGGFRGRGRFHRGNYQRNNYQRDDYRHEDRDNYSTRGDYSPSEGYHRDEYDGDQEYPLEYNDSGDDPAPIQRTVYQGRIYADGERSGSYEKPIGDLRDALRERQGSGKRRHDGRERVEPNDREDAEHSELDLAFSKHSPMKEDLYDRISEERYDEPLSSRARELSVISADNETKEKAVHSRSARNSRSPVKREPCMDSHNSKTSAKDERADLRRRSREPSERERKDDHRKSRDRAKKDDHRRSKERGRKDDHRRSKERGKKDDRRKSKERERKDDQRRSHEQERKDDHRRSHEQERKDDHRRSRERERKDDHRKSKERERTDDRIKSRDREKKDDQGRSHEQGRKDNHRRSKERERKVDTHSRHSSSSRKQPFHRSDQSPQRRKRDRSRSKPRHSSSDKRKSPSHRSTKRTRSKSPVTASSSKDSAGHQNLETIFNLDGTGIKEDLMAIIQKQAEKMLQNQENGPIDEEKKVRLRQTLESILKKRGLVKAEEKKRERIAENPTVLKKLHEKYTNQPNVEAISPVRKVPSPDLVQPPVQGPKPPSSISLRQKDEQDYEILAARLEALQSSEHVQDLISAIENKIRDMVAENPDSSLLEKRIKRYQKLVAKVVIKAETIKEKEEEDSYKQYEPPAISYPVSENKPWLQGRRQESKGKFQPIPSAGTAPPPSKRVPESSVDDDPYPEEGPDDDSKTLVKLIEDIHTQFVSSRPGYHVCLLCMTEATNETQFNTHLMGKQHKEAVTAKIRKTMNPSSSPKEVKCGLCNLIFPTESKYNEHARHRSHTTRIEAYRKIGRAIPPPEFIDPSDQDIESPAVGREYLAVRKSVDSGYKPVTSYYCSLCDVPCSSELQVEKHVRSRQHNQLYTDKANEEDSAESRELDRQERRKKMYQHAQAAGAILPIKKAKKESVQHPPHFQCSTAPGREDVVSSSYTFQKGTPVTNVDPNQTYTDTDLYDGYAYEQADPYADYPAIGETNQLQLDPYSGSSAPQATEYHGGETYYQESYEEYTAPMPTRSSERTRLYDPSGSAPSRYDPSGTAPTRYDPSGSETSARYDPSVTDPGRYNPAVTDPGRYNPAVTDLTRYDPPVSEPARYNPSATEPAPRYEPPSHEYSSVPYPTAPVPHSLPAPQHALPPAYAPPPGPPPPGPPPQHFMPPPFPPHPTLIGGMTFVPPPIHPPHGAPPPPYPGMPPYHRT